MCKQRSSLIDKWINVLTNAGFMGTAILKGLLQRLNSSEHKYEFLACVRSSRSLEQLKSNLADYIEHVSVGSGDQTAGQMALEADIILLGCAPGDLSTILAVPDLVNDLKGKLVISMLAGVSYSQLADAVVANGGTQDHCNFVRLLPSLGAQIGQSVTLVAEPKGGFANVRSLSKVEDMFGLIGTTTIVPEAVMAEATALGAACHALTIVAVDTMADASAADGLDRQTSLAIVQQCLRSASSLMLDGMTPEKMKDAMAISKGITINSILNLEKTARPAMAENVRQAISYTRQMA